MREQSGLHLELDICLKHALQHGLVTGLLEFYSERISDNGSVLLQMTTHFLYRLSLYTNTILLANQANLMPKCKFLVFPSILLLLLNHYSALTQI